MNILQSLSQILRMACAAALLLGCSKPAALPRGRSADVLAKIGAREIRAEDLRAEAQRRGANSQPIPAKSELLEEMVLEEAYVQRALALGVDKDPEVRRAWRSLLIGTLKNRELDGKLRSLEISPTEIAAAYEAARPSFVVPESARIGIVVISKPPSAPAQQRTQLRERMEEARALAATGAEGFTQAALKYSEHQASRFRGGDIGWVQKSRPAPRLPSAVTEAAFALLKTGLLSEIIEEPSGFYLVTLLERSVESVVPIEKVEAKIRARLTRERRDILAREFEENVRKLAGTEIVAGALERVDLPAPTPSIPAPPALPRTATH